MSSADTSFHSLTRLPTTDPALVLNFRDRQYGAELIAVAVLDLQLFDWLDKNEGATLADVCQHFSLEVRPADVLMTLCRASGFVTDDGNGASDARLSLTQLGREHMTSNSPWYLGPYFKPIQDSPIVQGFASILRTGKPANWQAKSDGADWHESMKDESFARDFTDLMNCRGLGFGQQLAKALTGELSSRSHLLDVGGGSGIYATTMVAQHPHMKATVLEQSPVDHITRKEIARHRLSDKVDVCTADMFRNPWPTGADVLLFSNVLHDWDVPEVETLLRLASETLSPGGLLVIHDAFINESKSGPLPIAEYSALLMNITQGKCYSTSEYRQLLEKHGFQAGDYQTTIGNRGFMTATRR